MNFKAKDFLIEGSLWSLPKEGLPQAVADQANKCIQKWLDDAPVIEITNSMDIGWFGEECIYTRSHCSGCQGRTHKARLINIEEFKKSTQRKV